MYVFVNKGAKIKTSEVEGTTERRYYYHVLSNDGCLVMKFHMPEFFN